VHTQFLHAFPGTPWVAICPIFVNLNHHHSGKGKTASPLTFELSGNLLVKKMFVHLGLGYSVGKNLGTALEICSVPCVGQLQLFAPFTFLTNDATDALQLIVLFLTYSLSFDMYKTP